MKDRKQYCQVTCPACGYRMPVFFTEEAECHGVQVSCKGRDCTNVFEVIIEKGRQIK